jgi:hypothetical protein
MSERMAPPESATVVDEGLYCTRKEELLVLEMDSATRSSVRCCPKMNRRNHKRNEVLDGSAPSARLR